MENLKKKLKNKFKSLGKTLDNTFENLGDMLDEFGDVVQGDLSGNFVNISKTTTTSSKRSHNQAKGAIKVNGKTYKGKDIKIVNDKVWVDGVEVEGDLGPKISIVGDIVNLTCDESVDVQGNVGEVKAKGSVNCGDVTGNVESGGSCNCDDIEGDLNANGSVNCDSVGGGITAGGSVISN